VCCRHGYGGLGCVCCGQNAERLVSSFRIRVLRPPATIRPGPGSSNEESL